MKTLIALAAFVLVACNSVPEKSEPSASGTAKAESKAPGSERKLKTKLTHTQVNDAWAGLKGNHDFAKHSEMMTAKLGAAHEVTGDKSCWYGYKPAEGPVPDDCIELCTSATKGSGTSGVSGTGKCWE